MSETERFKGKLTPTGKSIDDYVATEYPEWKADKHEFFSDHLQEVAMEFEGVVYTIEFEEINEYEDVFTASKNEDGTIDFEVKYYNGSCGFSESLDCAVGNIT